MTENLSKVANVRPIITNIESTAWIYGDSVRPAYIYMSSDVTLIDGGLQVRHARAIYPLYYGGKFVMRKSFNPTTRIQNAFRWEFSFVQSAARTAFCDLQLLACNTQGSSVSIHIFVATAKKLNFYSNQLFEIES